MSQENVLKLLLAARESPAMLARYNRRNLAQLLFHAKNDGFECTADEVAAVVGKLEASVIVSKDGDAFDQTSRLWLSMWGKRHFEYLIEHVVRRHTDDELWSLLTRQEAGV